MTSLERIIELITTYDRFVILMHEKPDGDTIACSLAFARVLRQLGKSVQCVSKDAIPKPFQFLPDIETIQSDFLAGDYEVMIVLDCGDLRRTGFPERVRGFAKHQRRVIHIDHHQKSDLYKLANVRLFDSSASATSEVLYPLFQLLPITIDADIATCLLTSLYYDTGAFKHANTTKGVLRLAAQLLSLGGRLREITQHVELTKSVSALKLWGIALARAKRHQSLKIVTSLLTQEDIRSSGASEEDVAGIVNLLNSVPGSKAAILLSETQNGMIRASLRTEDSKVDVAQLAALFGGGGLRRASGFCLPGKIVVHNNNWHVHLVE
jgi:bifunctional oligoribonuclease and PAP phosphatase NrnA